MTKRGNEAPSSYTGSNQGNQFDILPHKISCIRAVVTVAAMSLICGMADSFTKVYLQLVFSTRQRVWLIEPEWKADLHRYMAGILKNQKQLPIAINSMPDHIHFLLAIGGRELGT